MLRSWCILLGLLGVVAHAQEPLRFQHLTTADGLSDNAITCVYEDRAGYIWIGTERGLDRYDGNRIEQLDLGDPRFTNAHIASVIEDADRIIWVATLDGALARYAPRKNEWRTWIHDPKDKTGIPCERINCLFDLDDSTMMIGGSPIAVTFLDKRSFVFTPWMPELRRVHPVGVDAREGRGWCHAITALPDNKVWIGLLHDYTSLVMERGDRTFSQLMLNTGTMDQTQTCASMIGGTLYMGGWQNDIACLRTATWNDLPPIRTPDETTALAEFTGRLLIGTKRSGLLLYDPMRGSTAAVRHHRSDPSSLASDQVRCVLLDRSGNLWVGTANGLSVHAPSVWRIKVTDLAVADDADHSDPEFFSLEQDGDGTLRIYSSEGIFLRSSGSDRVELRPVGVDGKRLRPTLRSPVAGGQFLLGTETGLVRCDARTGNSVGPFTRSQTGIRMGGVEDMYQVRGVFPDTVDGTPVWVVGALGFGVITYHDTDGSVVHPGQNTTMMPTRAAAMVRDMKRDANGTYWWATDGGVTRWNAHTDKFHFFTAGDGPGDLPDPQATALLFDDHNVYVTLRDRGLVSIAGDQVSRHPLPHGRTAVMTGLTRDHDGTIWITTQDGLERFDPKTGSYLHVPVNDGRTISKLGPAITTLRNGHIALCAGNRLIEFDPLAYDPIPDPPEAVLIGAHSAGRAVPITDGIASLSYRASVIDITVSALQPVSSARLEFLYRLDGVETTWRTTTAREAIRYAGVPVGSHRLLVKVRDAYIREGPEQVLLTITVAGPIWQQWWFYAFALALIAIGLYLLFRYRLKQAMKLQAVRNRIASDLHDEVGSSLSSITIGSQLASQLSNGENARVKELMARIGETSDRSLRSMSDIVWAIDPKNDEGEALVKRMRRIANDLLESKGVAVEMNVSGGVEELKLPMNARKDLLLIFKEAMHNVSKYAEARRVTIDLSHANGSLSLFVKDDGKGFDPSLHPDGHGLGSMQRRAVALGTTLQLQSAPGQGTKVGVAVDLVRIKE